MADKLKPCPWCQNLPPERGDGRVKCQNQKCHASGYPTVTRDEWNHRAPDPLAEQIAAVVEETRAYCANCPHGEHDTCNHPNCLMRGMCRAIRDLDAKENT